MQFFESNEEPAPVFYISNPCLFYELDNTEDPQDTPYIIDDDPTPIESLHSNPCLIYETEPEQVNAGDPEEIDEEMETLNLIKNI